MKSYQNLCEVFFKFYIIPFYIIYYIFFYIPNINSIINSIAFTFSLFYIRYHYI